MNSSAKEAAMQVRDGMSDVSVTVGPSHTLRQAAKAMVDRNVGAALVIDDETPTPGIVTERDLLLSVGAGEDPDVETVGAHMTESVLTAAPDWSLEHAAAEMSRRSVRHLVVYDEADVVGILSMRDIVRVWTSDGATSEMPLPSPAGGS
jgi:signal-transduction protein with cAMP-binding, CBS, and nucleotidyltransferase domain